MRDYGAEDDLRVALRKHIDAAIDTMTKRPRMCGSPSQMEAAWATFVALETLLLTPRPTSEALQAANFHAIARVCIPRGWAMPHPLSSHGLTEEELVEVLLEYRRLFLRHLTETKRAPDAR